MNNNFEIILKNNKEFIDILNSVLKNFCDSDRYSIALSVTDKKKIVRTFFEYLFSNLNPNFNDSIKLRNSSKLLENLGKDILKFEDKNGLEWSLEFLEEESKFKLLNTLLVVNARIDLDIDCTLYFNRELSVIDWYCSKTDSEEKVDFIKQNVDQELIDFNLISRDLDISFLRNIGVNDIIYDLSNLKKIVRDHIKIENKKNKLEI